MNTSVTIPANIESTPRAPADDDQILTTREAAKFLRLAPSTLVTWRSTGKVHVPYLTFGGAVRYRLADLRAFIDSRTAAASARAGTSDPDPEVA